MKNLRGIKVETFKGREGACGFEAKVFRPAGLRRGGAAVALKGGLFDIGSASLEPLAQHVVEAGDGEVMAYTIRTIRPLNPLVALSRVCKAREQRSQSMHGAVKAVTSIFENDVIIDSGQSQGGITSIDAAKRGRIMARRPNKTIRAAVVIDTPGVFGPLDETSGITNVPKGLLMLAKNCAPDLRGLSLREQIELAASYLGHMPSPWEFAYVASEINYLRTVDATGPISELREDGAGVYQIFHSEDIVPGAETPSEFSLVLPGTHTRFLREPGPVVEHIAGIASNLLQQAA